MLATGLGWSASGTLVLESMENFCQLVRYLKYANNQHLRPVNTVLPTMSLLSSVLLVLTTAATQARRDRRTGEREQRARRVMMLMFRVSLSTSDCPTVMICVPSGRPTVIQAETVTPSPPTPSPAPVLSTLGTR